MRFIQYLAFMLPVSLAYANNDEKIFTSNGQANIVNNNGMVKNITTVQNGNLLSDITMFQSIVKKKLHTQQNTLASGVISNDPLQDYLIRATANASRSLLTTRTNSHPPRRRLGCGKNGQHWTNGKCIDCDSGRYSAYNGKDHGASSCKACSGGKYASSRSTSCSTCNSGQYSSSAAASCSNCNPGQYSGSWIATPNAVAGPSLGSFTCNSQWPCNLVTALNPSFMENYANVVIASVVHLQWTGGKMYYYGAKQPTGNAGAGGSTVHSLVGAPSCSTMTNSSCPPGRFYSSASATSVVSWTYSGSSANDAICTDCPAGYIKTTTTVPACPLLYPFALEYITTDSGTGNWYCYKTADKNVPCSYVGTLPTPSGQGIWNQNQADCDPGPLLGTYGLCTMCLPGTFESDHTVCKSCPTGFQSNNSISCSECVKGKQFTSKTEACTICLAGTYQDQNNAAPAVCDDCPAGRYLIDTATSEAEHDAQTDCLFCDKGKQFTSKTEACTICLAGTYQDQNNAAPAVCDDCPAGRYLIDTATSEAEHDAQTDCLFCDKGKQFTSMTTSCTICDAGMYQDQQDTPLTVCKSCPTGFQSTNSTYCSECVNGQYQNEEKQISCKTCSKGKFATDLRSVKCHDCAAGLYQDQAPAIAYRCQSCGKGENSPSKNRSCVNCAIGRYQELTIALTWGICKTCSKGQATSSAEGPSCSPCSLGHFQGKSDSDVYSCKTCAAGRAAVNADSDACVVCGAGQVQPEQATSSYGCIECQVGKINDDETKNVERHDQFRDCVDCDAGKYNAFPGKDECAICETAVESGASKCNGCAPGKHLNSTGDCEDCK